MRTQEKRSQATTAYQKRHKREAKAPLGLEAVPEPNAPWSLPLLVPLTGLLLCRFLASRSRLVQRPRARQIGAQGKLPAQDLASIPKGSLIPVEDGPGRGGEGIDRDPAKI